MIYFVRASSGPIKIGHADDHLMRLRSLRAGSAEPLTMLVAIDGDVQKEREYHARFDKYRMHSEWFRPGPELLAEIAKHPRFVEPPPPRPIDNPLRAWRKAARITQAKLARSLGCPLGHLVQYERDMADPLRRRPSLGLFPKIVELVGDDGAAAVMRLIAPPADGEAAA